MTAEHLASLAASLRDNDAFQLALRKIRDEALESLARVPATDADAIRDYQATVRVVDDIHGQLDTFIRSGKPRVAPGIA